MADRVLKKYNLYILRTHFQVRAKQKMLGSDWYSEERKQNLDLYQHKSCPEPREPEVKKVEKHEILLDTTIPNLPNLYGQIQEVCPEFADKRSFHLYWKSSAKKVVPISNYISYLSMVAMIAESNNNLYLVAREWNEDWLQNPAVTYMALPEDQVLVNMVCPRQSVYTRTQEYQLNIVKTAARPEFTRTYSPPARELDNKDKGKGKQKEKKGGKTEEKKPGSPKSTGKKKK